MVDGQITYEQLFDALRREKSRDELQKLDDGFYRLARLFLIEKHAAILAENASGYGGLGAQRASIEYTNAKRIIRELYDRRERKIVTLAMHRSRTDAAVVDTGSLLPEERVFFDTVVELLLQTREQVFAAIGVDGASTLTPDGHPRSAHSVLPSHSSSHPLSHSSEHRPTIVVERNISPDVGADVDAASHESGDYPSLSYRPTALENEEDLPENVERNTARDIAVSASVGGEGSAQQVALFRVRFTGAVPKVMGADGKIYGPFAVGSLAEIPDEIARVLIKKGRAQESDASSEE
jgi:DNA replication initiation complex subunit (GINS family)